MIDINLLPGKKNRALEMVGGRIGALNFKFLIFALLIHIVGRPFLDRHWEGILKEKRFFLDNANKELSMIKEKSREYTAIREEVKRMVEDEQKLNEKFNVVKKIIKQKKNPMAMLLYLAKNIPEDVWLNTVNIEKDTITIVGESKSYKSIGRFMEALNNSIFFGKKVEFKSADTITDKSTGKRTEVFTLESSIERYF